MTNFLVFLSTALLMTTANAENFSIAKYIQQCGGKIYSKCDSPELNQHSIFEEARTQAINGNQQIMIVIGADWCPSCQIFSKMIKSDPNAQKLHSQFVVIEINGELSSAKSLAKKLKFTYMAYPQAFIVKPANNEVVQQFYPSQYSNVETLLANVGVKKLQQQKVRPTQVGNVLVSSLEKIIELSSDYGTSTFISKPISLAEKYVNQGIAALHVYHYLDAYRSFKQAEKNDSDNVMSYVGQVLAILQIDPYEDGQYFASEANEKIQTRSKKFPLSKIESAWFEFGKSFQMASSPNYVKDDTIQIKSLSDSYEDIIKQDPSNIDGHSLITWLALSALDPKQAKPIFEAVLKKQPNNIGAHHSLLHLYEMENDEKKANFHATTLARLAPKSAHAQHMYGHTLPQKGRWTEALAYFKKADDIHNQWSKKSGLDINQDWHYAHNLDLMAAVYLGLGDLDRAKQTWRKATNDSRAVFHYLALSVLTESASNADILLKNYEKSGWGNYLKPLRRELELTPQSIATFKVILSSYEESEYHKILQQIAGTSLQNRDSKLSEKITSYFAKKFKSGGFDGWSNAYIELLRLKRVAKILSMNWLVEDIGPLEFAIQSGSLCSNATKAQGLTRCLK